MTVMVTGSAGFIGSHVVDTLRSRDVTVVEVDRRTGDDISSYDHACKVFDAVPDLQAVIHLAGSCSTPGSIKQPMQTYQDTAGTAINVIELCREFDVPLIMTTSVKARDAQTPYGAAKSMIETWATEYRRAYGMKVLVNRPGTIYGPGQEGSPESGWVAWFLKAKASNRPVIIHGDGSQVRDLLHVHDYVNLLLLQLAQFERYLSLETVFDVGGGYQNAVSVKELADHLELTYTFGPHRYGDSLRYVGINNTPDWHPVVKWQEALGV